MPKDDKFVQAARFRHESLQDRKTIRSLLDAISKGLAKGELDLSDEDGSITLTPNGLMQLRVRAERQDGQNRLDLRVSWAERPETLSEQAAPKVKIK